MTMPLGRSSDTSIQKKHFIIHGDFMYKIVKEAVDHAAGYPIEKGFGYAGGE
ncbi:hypothetical protein MPER_11233 [Moniliophthora perniciosa FA553]|nr:hypothetical protein MPER_11233 [Moniliophthora perniciosa FA553]